MDALREKVCSILEEILQEEPPRFETAPPGWRPLDWKNYVSDVNSYQKWAAMELLSDLKTYPSTPVSLTLQGFRDQMEAYSLENSDTCFLFSTAKDLAEGLYFRLCL